MKPLKLFPKTIKSGSKCSTATQNFSNPNPIDGLRDLSSKKRVMGTTSRATVLGLLWFRTCVDRIWCRAATWLWPSGVDRTWTARYAWRSRLKVTHVGLMTSPIGNSGTTPPLRSMVCIKLTGPPSGDLENSRTSSSWSRHRRSRRRDPVGRRSGRPRWLHAQTRPHARSSRTPMGLPLSSPPLLIPLSLVLSLTFCTAEHSTSAAWPSCPRPLTRHPLSRDPEKSGRKNGNETRVFGMERVLLGAQLLRVVHHR
jgi:hypothetical protein